MQDQNRRVFSHHGLDLVYSVSDRGLLHYAMGPGYARRALGQGVPAPSFQVAVAGRPYGFLQSMISGLTALPQEMSMDGPPEEDGNRLRLRYRHPELGLVVEVLMHFVPDCAVVRVQTLARNEGDAPIVLTHLSSMVMQGIALAGRRWDQPGKVRVHYCRQAWHTEGQWREADLAELGVISSSPHPESTAFHVSSVGSFSTASFLPMAVIEDREEDDVWFFQIEASSSWHYEIACRGSWTNDSGSLFIHADGADERHGGWTHELLPGQSFEAVPVAVGACRGGFEEAVHELTVYRRTVCKPAPAWEGEAPVFFNDYMNCLWGNPNEERLLPLIKAAADVGMEGFCIDAGWFGGRGNSWGDGLGSWEPSADRFGDKGLQGILDTIRDHGMIPGLWLEMEVCGERSRLGTDRPDTWFLRRNGRRVGGGPRLFLNYANPEVRAYMMAVIDRLVGMGVGFFKNDYNECTGPGDDALGTSAADGLLVHSRAFYSFMDDVRARHPRVIWENCGSGAMRQDYGILSHFHLQSSSDQEYYHFYPSIVTGSLASVLPEQLGVWAYPCPLMFLDRDRPDVLSSDAFLAGATDAEQTVFNMVNGLVANLYLSGRIDRADDRTLGLIREAVMLYRRERAHVHHGFPLWPLGMNAMHEKESWAAVGIRNAEDTRILLAVWRRESPNPQVRFAVPRWTGRPARLRQLYPANSLAVAHAYDGDAGVVTVEMEGMHRARLFELQAVPAGRENHDQP
jgi:alpha-galactosidase